MVVKPAPKLAEQVKEWNDVKAQMPIARPFLNQIDADLTHKVEQYNALGREIATLEGFKATLRRHEEFDSLVAYFMQSGQQANTTAGANK